MASRSTSSFPCVFLLIIWMVSASLWPYTINTWLVYAGREPVITFWHGMILALVPYLGQLTVPAAVITWILMLFISNA